MSDHIRNCATVNKEKGEIMKIIEDLYYGNIDSHTRRAQPDTALSKMRSLLIQNERKHKPPQSPAKRVCGGGEEKARLSMRSRLAGPHDITGFLLSRLLPGCEDHGRGDGHNGHSLHRRHLTGERAAIKPHRMERAC